MPLTDFLKNFLQKLPENIQYLGTDVAPLMGPNWQQAIQSEQQRQMQMGAAQQQQENWEKQFGAQEQQRQQQNQFQQGQLMLEAIRNNLIPQGAQPQRTPGGPGLNGGGANPSFGAGGGAGAAPTQAPSPDPSNMSSIAPFMAMLSGAGQQQTGGQSVNAAGQTAPGGQPPMRMPGMSGDSGGGGGATVPSAFNIPGINGPMIPKQEPVVPLHPDIVKAWPELAQKYPNGMPISQYKNLEPQFDKMLGVGAKGEGAKDNPKEVMVQSRLVAAGIPGDWRQVAKTNPDAYAKAVAEAEDLSNPQLALQRREQEQNLADKLKLAESEKNNAIAYWDRVKADPSAWFDKEEDKKTRTYTEQLAKQRGEENFIPKKPLDTVRQQSEAFAMDVLSGNNKLRSIASELMQEDPAAFGAIAGRWNETLTHIGAPVGRTPKANYLINAFLDNINPLLARDTKQLSGGRAAIQMMNMLKQSFPTLHTNPGALAAAFDTADGIAKNTIRDNRLFSYGITDPKKFYPGEELSHKSGQTFHFKRYTPDGKIETMEEGQ